MQNDLVNEKRIAAIEAVKLVQHDQVVGLGTGSTAEYATREIGRRVRDEGLRIRGVATSKRTAELSRELGIQIMEIDDVREIDITIDGADEFTTDLLLIKGGGGALLREKIVASMTRQQVIIADSSKKVESLGKFPLPIEVVPFATNYVLGQLHAINGSGKVRQRDSQVYLTDHGNHIIDADFGSIHNPVHLSSELNNLEGVVGHGLFINLAHMVIMGTKDGVEVFRRKFRI